MEIPRYTRVQRERPSITVDTSSLGADLLGVLSKRLERYKAQKDNEDFILQCADFDDRIRSFEMTELDKTGHDTAGNIQRGSDLIENLASEKLSRFTNPELADRFEVYAAARRERLLNRLGQHHLVQTRVALKDTIDKMIESRSKIAYTNPDDLVSELELAKIDLDQLDAPNKDEIYRNIQSTLTEHALEGILNSNPGELSTYIEKWKDFLTQDQVEAFKKKEQRVVARMLAQEKLETEAKWEEERNELLPRIFSGEATDEDIDKTSLPAKEKYAWKEKLFMRNKAIAEGAQDPFETVNPEIDSQVMRAVYSPTPPTREDIMSLIGHGLSVNRAEHWIKVLDKPDNGYKRALEYLKSQITPRGSLMEPEDADAADAYWRSVMALDDMLQRSQEEGKPLSGNEILKAAREIAPQYTLSFDEIIEKKQQRLDELRSSRQEKEEEKKGFVEELFDLFKVERKEGSQGETAPQQPQQQQKATAAREEGDEIIPAEYLTDRQIGIILKKNGYAVTPENIKRFREQNS